MMGRSISKDGHTAAEATGSSGSKYLPTGNYNCSYMIRRLTRYAAVTFGTQFHRRT